METENKSASTEAALLLFQLFWVTYKQLVQYAQSYSFLSPPAPHFIFATVSPRKFATRLNSGIEVICCNLRFYVKHTGWHLITQVGL